MVSTVFKIDIFKNPNGLTSPPTGPPVLILLDSQMFTISHAKTWNSLNLITLNHSAIKTDEQIIENISICKINTII